ncbi:amidase [Hypericibacter adhaerens]|uniref:Amidase n=1 Tax=Hypericibacter adhaerens TaxID=2602016 RepID=A0A5J6MV21_9PROT|nr:amidase [Hypericibacter adhaerens]QEX21121.1 amidase [Hypericibacter adhaerens]
MSSYNPRETRLLSFHDAVDRFRDGGDNPRAYLERCLERIEAREPEIRAFVTMNIAGARRAADESTARYRANRSLSAVDGMPVGIKDLYETIDMPTQMGSPIFAGWQGKRDAASVYALRQSGAVILGKTVTTEFGFYSPGPTRNPFDPQRTPGGSSSGSAAAVGAGFVPVAIGSQVVGSLIRPASYCGNYGFKPSLGALNRQGGHSGLSQACIGVHAGNLRDLWTTAHRIASIAGGDPGQPGLFGGAELSPPVKPASLIRLDTAGWSLCNPETQSRLDEALSRLEKQGVEIVSRKTDPAIEAFEVLLREAREMTHTICGYELRWPLKPYRELGPGSLSEDLGNRLNAWEHLTAEEYRAALTRRDEIRKISAGLLSRAAGFVTLSASGAAPLGIQNTGDPAFAVPGSLLGAPCISLPLLEAERLPLGLQLIGPLHGDAGLMGHAAWIAGHL